MPSYQLAHLPVCLPAYRPTCTSISLFTCLTACKAAGQTDRQTGFLAG